MSWTDMLGVALVCAAVAAWGCSKDNKVAELDHDHDDDFCLCHADHDHDHAHHAHASLEDIKEHLAQLSVEDRKLAEAQAFCVVRKENALGSMGVPYKLTIEGRPVFLCCEHCKDAALQDPKATLATLDGLLQKHTANLQKNVK
jgi:Cu(I)/Ag(I) efflux system membrane fusion protein